MIQLENLSKHFRVYRHHRGGWGALRNLVTREHRLVRAVDDVTLRIDRGELIGYLGPNGAGKSTTIKILTGILFPNAGDVQVLGYIPWKQRRQLAYSIGTVFGQRPQLWYHLPAIDTFTLFGKIYELDDHETKKRIAYLAEAFEIEDLLEIPVRKLSLGQRMRCEVAASLLHKPRLLLLDEPSIGLDVVAKQHIRDAIREMAAQENVGVLLTSHDAGDLEALCKRVIIINHGQIVYQDKVSVLKRSYLTSKLVEVRYAQQINPDFHVEGTEILKISKDHYAVKLRFDTLQTPVENVMAHLSAAGTLLDITVSDPPLEEVIAAIYEKAERSE